MLRSNGTERNPTWQMKSVACPPQSPTNQPKPAKLELGSVRWRKLVGLRSVWASVVSSTRSGGRRRRRRTKILTSSDLSEELTAFIEAVIPSVWALELLILVRSDPARAWTPKSLVAALRASDRLVADILPAFERTGLVLEEGEGVRYAPPPSVDRLCAELEAAYRQRPVSVVNAIVRQRSGALSTFADAFRLGGKKS